MEKLLNGLRAVINLLLGSILVDLISSIREIVVILYRPFDLRLGNLVSAGAIGSSDSRINLLTDLHLLDLNCWFSGS